MKPQPGRLMTFSGAIRHDPAIDAWFDSRPSELGAIGRRWFTVMRECGEDVRELIHDLHPTACVGDAAFGYVNVFTSHVNVGFFLGAELPDPAHLLEGTGKFMRHVKLTPDDDVDENALTDLIKTAYSEMKEYVKES
jgi:hypothetical protein